MKDSEFVPVQLRRLEDLKASAWELWGRVQMLPTVQCAPSVHSRPPSRWAGYI